MIAIVNNCMHAIELSKEMRTRYGNKDEQFEMLTAISKNFEVLCQTYEVKFSIIPSLMKYSVNQLSISIQSLRKEAAGFLLEEAFLDAEPHFQDLHTRKWITTTAPVDTICVTLEDYFQVRLQEKRLNTQTFYNQITF